MVVGSFDHYHFLGWFPLGYKWFIGLGTIYLFIVLNLKDNRALFMRSNSSNKESILAITFLLLLLFIYSRNFTFIYITLGFIFVSLLSNSIASFFDLIWKKLTHILGLISSTIILSIIFYVIVFPWGMILKLINKNPMLLNSNNKTSTFINRNKLFTNNDLKNPY